MMETKFNATGERRKEMVGVISGIVGMRPVYMGVPTCNYVIDNFTVTKDGTLVYDGRSESELVEKVLEGLVQAGFQFEQSAAETADTAQETETTDNPTETEITPQSESVGLTVAMPADSFTPDALNNLHALIHAKGQLLRKALGVELLPVQVEADKVSFPWFNSNLDAEEVKAYTHLISALCEMARNQKRITAKEKDTDNDKYAFRCFLLRLGFIGAEFKTERKILLRNLTGSSAFKGGTKDAVSE